MTRLAVCNRALALVDRHLDQPTQPHGPVRVVREALPPASPRVQPDPDPSSDREAERLRQLRAAITTRLERGDTLETVEGELIASSGLPEAQQSALWLYTWLHPQRRADRQPRLSVWTALANALLTLVGIYRY